MNFFLAVRGGVTYLIHLFRFINQHDGDIIFDAVDQAAFVAEKFFVLRIVLQFPFAFGANQDIKQFFIQHIKKTSSKIR